jgi:hypothetical protein
MIKASKPITTIIINSLMMMDEEEEETLNSNTVDIDHISNNNYDNKIDHGDNDDHSSKSINDSGSTGSNSNSSSSCTILHTCMRCTNEQRETISECMTTGRIATFHCLVESTATTTSGSYTRNSNDDTTIHPRQHHPQRNTLWRQQQQRQQHSNNNDPNIQFLLKHNKNDNIGPTITTIPTTLAYDDRDTKIYYSSCYYTNNEYEFNFIQFQVLICLIGMIAIYSIQKQKIYVASLFDQRRLVVNKTKVNSNNTSDTTISGTTGTIEMKSIHTTTSSSSNNHNNKNHYSSNNNNNKLLSRQQSKAIEETKSLLSPDMDIV